MPTTYEPIATTTLGSDNTTVSFTSISGSYTDLICVVTGSVVSVTNPRLRFNSDTGSNYSVSWLAGDGSSATSGRQSNQAQALWGAYDASIISTGIIHIQNYSNSTTYKTFLSRNSLSSANSGQAVSAWVGLWRSTAAITSIELFTSAGNEWKSGNTFTLYGIKAA